MVIGCLPTLHTVKPLLGGPPIKRTPFIKHSLSLVPKLASCIYLKFITNVGRERCSVPFELAGRTGAIFCGLKQAHVQVNTERDSRTMGWMLILLRVTCAPRSPCALHSPSCSL